MPYCYKTVAGLEHKTVCFARLWNLHSDLISLQRVNCDNDLVKSDDTVNPHPFRFVLNNEKMCGADLGRDVFLLMYVHTSPENFWRRTNIRATWGDPKYYFPHKIRLIFIVGTPDNATKPGVLEVLAKESAIHRDIVQSSFADDYRNLTYKAISALKWVSTYCRNAKFVLKTDDDIVVNPFTLMAYLPVGASVQNTIVCRIYERGIIFRKGYRKLVTMDEWPVNHYPPFCSGSAHVMSTDVVVALYKHSFAVGFYWPDDVFITGLLPFRLDNIMFVQLAHKMEVIKEDTRAMGLLTGPKWQNYIFGHMHNSAVFMEAWYKIVSLAKECTGDICYRTRQIEKQKDRWLGLL